ncbi:Protein PNS1 [Seminavis robusta]|uniref:Choline transporter-like protein n=1 Tax=Seminavis robusta TaxID=568900 RepID=A0A9N8E8W3_9STRA|nr:Protein PNS1 [Seminavis robusta]|eukprot:Sro675_g185510.1 Protein PNS1 (618) ;mRNA; r:30891-32914
MTTHPTNVETSEIPSTTAKVDHTYTPSMDDSAPLLVATPLYGTAQPETVIFDEAAVLPATAIVDGSQSSNHVQGDPLLIRGALSADLTASFSDKQEEPVYRDVPFAILFWVQLIVVLTLGFTIAPKGYAMMDFEKIKAEIEKDPDTSASDIQDFETFVAFAATYLSVYPARIITYLLYPTTLVAFSMALFIVTTIIRPCSHFMVTLCLIGWFVDACILMGMMVISNPSPVSLMLAVGVLSVVAYYIRAAWRLIPYSAVNLRVSLQGVQSNCAIYIVALGLAEIGFLWVFFWFYVVCGTMLYIGQTQCPDMSTEDDCDAQGPAFFFLFVSLLWTSQVINNLIQVTVAGVMGTWCFDYGHARNCCSSAIWSSLYRSFTFSFGSICFGSLLMAVVRVIRYFVEGAKQQRDRRADNCEGCEMLSCILDCLIKLFEDVLDYFNHWSYVFCGLYGYSYLQSGKMVLELFRARGWETFVTNDLISSVLTFTTFSVGCCTGLASMGLERLIDSMKEPDVFDAEAKGREPEQWEINTSFLFGPLPHAPFLALGFGFLIGVIVCSIMMSVVRGAVNTLIVCWADSPARLEENHPEFTKDMADTWTSVFPQARVYVTSLPQQQPEDAR